VDGGDAGEQEEDNIEREGAEDQPKEDKDDLLKTQKHIYVPEAVREPRMHFYLVPKLGSFMAVPLIYNSCLFEDALENAVNDYVEV